MGLTTVVIRSIYNQNSNPPCLVCRYLREEIRIICQTKSEEDLVENSISHETVSNVIEERVNYGD